MLICGFNNESEGSDRIRGLGGSAVRELGDVLIQLELAFAGVVRIRVEQNASDHHAYC
jgi:hypothetical protein